MAEAAARETTQDGNRIAAELAQLAALHQSGALTDEEFGAAKARVIQGGPAAKPAHHEAEELAAHVMLQRQHGKELLAAVEQRKADEPQLRRVLRERIRMIRMGREHPQNEYLGLGVTVRDGQVLV